MVNPYSFNLDKMSWRAERRSYRTAFKSWS